MENIFCNGREYPEYYIPGFIITIIGSLLLIMASIHYIYCFFINKRNQPQTNRTFKWMLAIHIFIANIMEIIAVLAYIACSYDMVSLSGLARAISLSCWVINGAMLIFSVILRVYQTFKNSQYV